MKVSEATVLFVEDEPFLRESMCVWLDQKTGRMFCAEHGGQALQILAANKIDLVVSDVRMPVMDGIALVKKIHQTKPGPRIILITGFSDLSLREAYGLGVDAILEKPINREDLFRAMQRSLAVPEEFWRLEPSGEAGIKMHISFPSLAAALKEKNIAFGRRGFCIKSPEALREGPVDFVVEFKEDRRVLSGQGAVRWAAAREGQAGIEITRLDEACLPWILDLMKQTAAIAYIPASTAAGNAPKIEVA